MWSGAKRHCSSRPHEGHEIPRLAQVDDVVRVARRHAHRLDPLSGDLGLQHFVGLDIL